MPSIRLFSFPVQVALLHLVLSESTHTLQGGADDIIRDIMKREALHKLRRELEQLMRAPAGIKGSELKSIAEKLGRKRKKGGSEPTWIREDCPELSPPLSIPQHSKDLKKQTAKSIIHRLLSDIDEWEIFFNEEDDDGQVDG